MQKLILNVAALAQTQLKTLIVIVSYFINLLSCRVLLLFSMVVFLNNSKAENLGNLHSVLYAMNQNENTVYAYRIDQTSGMLAQIDIGTISIGAGSGDIENLNSKFLYTVGMIGDGAIHIFAIESSGTLSQISIANGQNSPWGLYMNNDNQYAYVPNTNSNTISMFKINNSTGQLIAYSPSTVPSPPGPSGLGFNPFDESHVYSASYYGNSISLYSMDPLTGKLSNSSNSISAGVNPRNVMFDNANHAYSINEGDATISQYKVDPSSGLLEHNKPSTIKTGATPRTSMIDKSGHYLYVGSYSENKVYMYKIESTGTLTPLVPATVDCGTQPRAITEDGYGHLYVANFGSNTISIYKMDEKTGLLQGTGAVAAKSVFGLTIVKL